MHGHVYTTLYLCISDCVQTYINICSCIVSGLAPLMKVNTEIQKMCPTLLRT